MAKKEPDSKSDAAALLERAQAQLERVKLGRGVVGKLTNIGLAFFGIIAIVVARSDNPWIMGGAIVSAVAAFGFFVYRVTEFADKHPEAALLEGAEFVAYKKLQMSAKGRMLPPPNDANAIAMTDPSAPAMVVVDKSEPDRDE